MGTVSKLETPDSFVEKLGRVLSKNEWLTFYVTFFSGIAMYIALISNWLANPDGIWTGLADRSVNQWYYTWDTALGRFAVTWWEGIKGYVVYPAGAAVFAIFVLAVIAVLLVKLFSLNTKLSCIITGLLVVLSPSVPILISYYGCTDSYAIGYLLAVVSIFILTNYKKVPSWIAATLLLGASLAFYQAYFALAVCLCYCYLFLMLINPKIKFIEIRKLALRYMSAGIMAAIGYMGLFKLLQKVFDFPAAAGRGFSDMAGNALGQLGTSFVQAYQVFYDYFFTNTILNNTWNGRNLIHMAAVVILVIQLILLIMKHKIYKNIGRLLLLMGTIILLPVAFTFVVIMAPGASAYGETGVLMLPQMYLFYLLVFLKGRLLPEDKKYMTIIKWLSALLVAIVLFMYVVFNAAFQQCMTLNMNKASTVSQLMLTRISMESEYKAGMPLIIGGKMEEGNYPRLYEHLYEITKGSPSKYGITWDNYFGRQGGWIMYLKQFKGVEFTYYDETLAQEILDSTQYQQMGLFPEESSVAVIDGVMVVKLSELEK